MATILIDTNESFDFAEGAQDLERDATDAFTGTDSPGFVVDDQVDAQKAGRDTFRVSESVDLHAGTQQLALPLYALVEQHHTTATIIDYQEVVADSEWRETGLELDI